ncbi:uncharacterized protein A1O9_03310 [Exophiala aquamarina CBS 119918]|uniref:CWF21 domain-containing protein n=1 Tax=Exophiala aquamarina CBS 119918 TaxID=1182545 RepID=A0A072Q1H9_9EURO|nr:uncharacterized protein A1O9_03310 [Exophiala aquamarina CBS 119918]KEF61740.1 hypothetical protein A1O9_03310 [Exophiala aquamarina CBS 119918]
MSSNVGLSTPRGSGTSGYVQRNLSVLKPRDAGVGVPYTLDGNRGGPPRTRKPDEDILKHDRLREIEVKVLELRDGLEDAGKLDDDEIEEETDKLREKLTREMERSRSGAGSGSKSRLKSYQVHEMAEAKERESDRLRRALGLKAGEVPEDGEHPMARQEKRRRQREEEEGFDADIATGAGAKGEEPDELKRER